MRTIGLVTGAFLTAATFWNANDPFVGKWKLDVSRSTIVDGMRIDALGPNKYAFSFEDGPRETIVADGTDQPGLPGTTLAVKAEGPLTLTVVRKKAGRTIVSAHWKLSPDGRTLRDSFTGLQPDGSKATTDYLYRRMAGTSGFAGDWESTTKPVGLTLELEIQPYDNKGLSFVSSGSKKSIVFDGRDHVASSAAGGPTYSGRRSGARTMEYTEKNRGKLERSRRFELSRDGRTLTEILRTPGQKTPEALVFERE
jgi:hypothetical protein